MMKAVLLESELYNGAMTDLTELKGQIEDVLIDYEEIVEAIEYIVNLLDTSAIVAGLHTRKEGARFEIVNNDADPETYMDIELITELES